MFKAIALQEGSKVPSQVQLLRTGSFTYEGEELDITTEILASLKQTFDEKVRGYEDGKLPIDYFHENERIAAGWIENLILQEDGNQLWATVKWTPAGAQKIESGELRYISVEYSMDYEDNESGQTFGPTLFGAGLTNRPFIKRMEPVMSFSEIRIAKIRKEMSSKVRLKLEQIFHAVKDPVSEMIAHLVKSGYPQDQAVAIAKDMERKGKLDENGGNQMDLAQAMAKIEELTKELEALKKEKDGMGAQMGDLQKKYGDMEQKQAMAEKKAGFDKMVNDGKAVEAQREAFMANDLVKFAELAKLTNPAGAGNSGSGGSTNSDKSASDQIIELAKQKMSENKKLSFREATSLVLNEKKDLHEQYNKEVSVA